MLSPRLAAQIRQCKYRNGDQAGCPCVYKFDCHVPDEKLTAEIKGEREKFEAVLKKAREAKARRKEQK